MPNGEEYKRLRRKIEEIENKLKGLRVRSEDREKLAGIHAHLVPKQDDIN